MEHTYLESTNETGYQGMSGRTTITVSKEEFDSKIWESKDIPPDPKEAFLTGVYIRMSVAMKKRLQDRAADKGVSMSSVVRDALSVTFPSSE